MFLTSMLVNFFFWRATPVGALGAHPGNTWQFSAQLMLQGESLMEPLGPHAIGMGILGVKLRVYICLSQIPRYGFHRGVCSFVLLRTGRVCLCSLLSLLGALGIGYGRRARVA